ncbi:MAG: hypothetical protein EBR09_09665 [Proteobacteria bacterium]|nr:hypothetical protein [Pseudomonadota bacterium]
MKTILIPTLTFFAAALTACNNDLSSQYKTAPKVEKKGAPQPVQKSDAEATAGEEQPVSKSAPPAPPPAPAPAAADNPPKPVSPNEPFQACIAGSSSQPITAKVYQLPNGTNSIGSATLNDSNFKTKICMTKFDVPTREFTAGFPGVPNLFEWFGLDARATLVAPLTGAYKFKIHSDDGAILFIDNQKIIEHDGQHPPSAKEGTVTLTAGSHTFRILYFQGPATFIALQLFWTPPNRAEEIVPTSAFRSVSF